MLIALADLGPLPSLRGTTAGVDTLENDSVARLRRWAGGASHLVVA
ncbi:MAG: hypothetical protein ACFCVA_13850 [Gammaproteobacteria bacterium]